MKVTLLDLPGLINIKNSIAKSNLCSMQPPVNFWSSSGSSHTRNKDRKSITRQIPIEIKLYRWRKSKLFLLSPACRLNVLPKVWILCVLAVPQTPCGRANQYRFRSIRRGWRQRRVKWTEFPSTLLHWRVSVFLCRKYKDKCGCSGQQVASKGLSSLSANIPACQGPARTLSHALAGNR